MNRGLVWNGLTPWAWYSSSHPFLFRPRTKTWRKKKKKLHNLLFKWNFSNKTLLNKVSSEIVGSNLNSNLKRVTSVAIAPVQVTYFKVFSDFADQGFCFLIWLLISQFTRIQWTWNCQKPSWLKKHSSNSPLYKEGDWLPQIWQ